MWKGSRMTDLGLLYPVTIFLLAAAMIAVVPRSWIGWVSLLAPIMSAIVTFSAWLTPSLMIGASLELSAMDYKLIPVEVDALGLLMVALFHGAALTGALFAHTIKDRLQHSAMLAYFAGGIGAVMAGDWISFFVFFEIIALAGAGLVFARRTEASMQAGVRYLLFQIAAGVTLLTGILWQGAVTDQWAIAELTLDPKTPYAFLFLFAFGLKAGFPLLHLWLVDAYPKASPTGLAVLVAVTTKVGIVGLLKTFPGESWLVPIGLLMALWPVGYVLSENNLRRVLAYSMMVQLGLMVMAIGVGTPLALDGVSWHIVMDVSFKMVFFMAFAIVLTHLGTNQVDQLSGLAKPLPVVAICVAVAALANVAMPLTGGFISKKMMLGAIDASTLPHAVYWMALSLSVLGLLYAWIRLTWRVFFSAVQSNMSLPHRIKLPWSQCLALLIPVVVLVVTGFVPSLIEGFRPFESEEHVFTLKTVTAQLALLGGGFVVYRGLRRIGWGLPRKSVERLWDADLIYRWVFITLPRAMVRVGSAFQSSATKPIRGMVQWVSHPKWPLQHLGQSWPIGAMALWVAVIFFVILVLGLINQLAP